MTAQKLQFRIKNLTKKTSGGELLYQRDEVVRQIEGLAAIDFAELKRRILITDEKSANSLKSETLVFLLREWFQKEYFNEIYQTLSLRILGIIGKYRAKVEDFTEVSQNVQLEFLQKVLDFKTDAGDYAQVSFGEFIVGLALNEFRKYGTVNQRENLTDSIDADAEDEETPPKFNFATRKISPEDEVFLNEALRKLPTNIREAFILYHYYNYKIKSKKTDEPTLTEYFQKSDKTIRNWLKNAEDILDGLR
ncbi:MAG: hypothetical protein ACR2MD_08270 [Aridibacter sp.]